MPRRQQGTPGLLLRDARSWTARAIGIERSESRNVEENAKADHGRDKRPPPCCNNKGITR
eukprot:scaffold12434_cov37-Tisochrysis_lutea.AAC.2